MITFPAAVWADWAAAKQAADERYPAQQAAATAANAIPRRQRTSAERHLIEVAAIARVGRERERVLDLLGALDHNGVIESLTPAQGVALMLSAHKAAAGALTRADSTPVAANESTDGSKGSAVLDALDSIGGPGDE